MNTLLCVLGYLLGYHFGIVKGGNCQHPHHLTLKTTSILLRGCCMALGKKGKPHTRMLKTWGDLALPGKHKNTDTQLLPESTGTKHRRVLLSLLTLIWGVFGQLLSAAQRALQEPSADCRCHVEICDFSSGIMGGIMHLLCALCWCCVSRSCIDVKVFMPRLVRSQLSSPRVVTLRGSDCRPRLHMTITWGE